MEVYGLMACLGIGENGHMAFNDLPVADFYDQKVVKVADPDEVCRRRVYHYFYLLSRRLL